MAKENGRYKVKQNLLSPLTHKYLALIKRGIPNRVAYSRWWDAERKIILTLETLFNGLKNINELNRFLLSSPDLDFCFSCKRCIMIVRDYDIFSNLEIKEKLAFFSTVEQNIF